MTDIILKIKEQLKENLPCAVYSKPGSDTVTGVFQNDAEMYRPGDFNRKGFVMAPFDGNAIFIPADASDNITIKAGVNEFIPPAPAAPSVNESEKEAFEALVSKSVAAIKKGEFKKLVVSRTERVTLGTADPLLLYQRLLFAYPNAFRYLFFHPAAGLWMGATPEQLLKVENNTLHTVALAGTQVYKEGEGAVWENKEKEEQQFVTGYILDSLKEYTTEIRITAPYTFRAGNLVHIKTDLSALLKGSSLKDVIAALHPTPAVCGLPKEKAKAFLLESEGYDREFYSGFLGELNHDFATGQGNTDLFVNLRCMKIENERAHLYIGCGITKDSDPEKEFYETVNKSMTMKRIL